MRKGTELQNRYVISEHIGTGGYASVWRATDKELNRDVAIKRLLRDNWRGVSAADVAAVLEEGRNAARLKGHSGRLISAARSGGLIGSLPRSE